MNQLEAIPDIDLQKLIILIYGKGIQHSIIAEALGIETPAVSRLKKPMGERTRWGTVRLAYNFAISIDCISDQEILNCVKEPTT